MLRSWRLAQSYFVLGIVGAYLGYAGYELILIRRAEIVLAQNSEHLLARSDAASREAREVLAAMKALRLPYCSAEELDAFGELLFRSRYLRDLGHMRDGKVLCSTVLGELRDHTAMKASFLQRDGTSVYSNHSAFPTPSKEMQAVTLQSGENYITFSPNLMAAIEDIRYNYSFYVASPVKGNPGPLFGGPLQLPQEILGTSGAGRIGNLMYSTRCSAHYFDCVTTYVSRSVVLRSSPGKALGFGLIGVMGGLFLAFLGGQFRLRWQALERQFRRALRDGRLYVVYQPIVDVKTNRTVGAEALARWVNEIGDSISPDTFIPMAERLGIMGKVTQNVLSRILNDLPDIIDKAPEFKISMNVTAAEVVGTDFSTELTRLVSIGRLSPHILAIEITERSTANEKELASGIERLHALGFSIYVDDFGTGYSSLSYLANLQIDMIKIDRSFTRTVGTNSAASIMLPHLLEIAITMHIGVIVEGVETDEQAAYFAADANRILAQGWYFGRPMPINILKERICIAENLSHKPFAV